MSTRCGPPLWEKWARFRYGVVASLLTSPLPAGELQAALAALAAKAYVHPFKTGQTIRFSKASIERWYYLARKAADPIAALGRKVRSDAGSERVMSAALLSALEAQYQQHRRWSYQLHWDNLVALVREKPELGPLPSYATVVRRMKMRGWLPRRRVPRNPKPGQEKAAERLERREVRSFERENAHALWHTDGHEGSLKVVDGRGGWHTPVLLAFLDDCSRLCAHAQWYLAENSENVIHAFCQAAAKRGLPREWMSDCGGAFKSGEVQQGFARLGVVHSPTLPYSAYQNGKQEEFWSQVEGRLLPMLEHVRPLTLSYLNRATQAWVELEYNRKRHDALKCTPLERLLAVPSVARPAPGAEALRLAFCLQEPRTQRRSDGTVSIQGVRFEVPSSLRHRQMLQVKYQSFDLSQAFVVDDRTGEVLARILPQDKVRNAEGWRRPVAPPPLPEAPVLPREPVPPLMRQLLSLAEADGLPPAYLPKDEALLEEGCDETTA